MKIVNPYLVAAILEPFLFLDEFESTEVAEINPEDEVDVRVFIRRFLVPYYLKFDDKSKSEIRDSLGYMLLKGSDKWEVLFQINQSPLSLPSRPQKFYEWLWDELYHCDVFLVGLLDDYVVREDIHAPNLIKRGGAV
ncbi:hypothetical protein [Burkholderia sp. GbtcB21]|uniref:hypothetical protein n=1 Tax=Burkholderia sp. GbtcB21 TaxID=2824766 RepID=UPI001C310895|nr:hypothetical protein [Burkholderia sp. GbtcB21]